jgi:peptidoglycan/LPS O-acetylase OafA/YrhL
VLPVILFHAGVPGFSGGFIGVDVFFVISGYLITRILAREISCGTFSIVSFYERRIRRIFPAFFVAIGSTALISVWLFMPSELKNIGSSMIAATFFLSNVLFWNQSGYFAAPSELNPLLHTWSLGIEEQFYLIFPVFLWLWLRFAGLQKVWVGVLMLGVVSFCVNVYTVCPWQAATFYLIATRAWELLLGAFLAIRPITIEDKPALRDALSIAGLLSIAWSVLTFSKATSFPGPNALFPCIGAGLIILAGGQSLAGRMISNRAFVFIGLISYSFYLMHWPIIVFSQYYIIRPLNGIEKSALVIFSFLAATLCWRFIEMPFRKPAANRLERQVLFAKAATAMTVCAAVGFMFYMSNGVPSRLSRQAEMLAAGSVDVGEYISSCVDGVLPDAEDIANRTLCKLGVRGGSPSFLLWGDSHAAAIADGIDIEAKRYGQSGLYVGMFSCPPLIGIDGWYKETIGASELCKRINSSVLPLIKRLNVKAVILDASWGRLGSEYGHQQVAEDSILMSSEYRRDIYDIDRAFRTTLNELKRLGVKLFIITMLPAALNDVPSTLARSAFIGRQVDISESVHDFTKRNEFPSKLFDHIARRYGAEFIRPDLALCNEVKCAVEKDGRALYSDRAHLSRFGAQSISSIFRVIWQANTPMLPHDRDGRSSAYSFSAPRSSNR